jgi:hypothetical protein
MTDPITQYAAGLDCFAYHLESSRVVFSNSWIPSKENTDIQHQQVHG